MAHLLMWILASTKRPTQFQVLSARKAIGDRAFPLQYLLGWVNPLDTFDPWRNSRVHVGPHRKVLGLLRNPLGQRHLAGRLLSHVRRLRKPLRLAFCVRKTIALSSLLKSTRQQADQCLPTILARHWHLLPMLTLRQNFSDIIPNLPLPWSQ